MPTTKAPGPKPPSPKPPGPHEVTAEATPLPIDESAALLQSEQDVLSRPGRAARADAEFIDHESGYSRDQLAHMREYYGIDD